MLGMLLAYNDAGDVIATLDYLVNHDDDGTVRGLVDFVAHEEAGGEMLDVWKLFGEQVENGVGVPWEAKGSKTWPEWIGAKAHEFRVELAGPAGKKRIAALVHKVSGHRRERAAVESEIATRIAAKKAEAHEQGEQSRAAQRADLKAARDALKQELREVGEPVALVELYLPDVPEPADPEPEPVDIRDLVGGPNRPLMLDDDGRTKPRTKSEPLNVPLVSIGPTG
jgi:hypothetical protein